MRKTLIVTLLLFTLFISGALNGVIARRRSMANVYYVLTTGIDISIESNDLIRLSIIAKKPKKSTEKNKYYVYENTPVFNANRDIRKYLNKDVFWGHLEYILISEEMAQKNISQYIDFFTRDYELKLTANVIYVLGSTSEDVMKMVTDSGEDVTDTLHALTGNYGAISISGKVTVLDVFNQNDNKYTCTYVPIIEIKKDEKLTMEVSKEDEKNSEKEEDKKLVLDGYAFFDQETTDFLLLIKGDTARGFNFIKNEIKSGDIHLKDSEGERVSVEIINSKTKIIPEIKDDKITVKIENTFSTNIVEVRGSEDIFNDKSINELVKQQNKIIQDEIQAIIDLAIEHNADLIDVSGAISHKYPVKWDKIKDDWRNVFKEIKFDVSVESKINRSYIIKEPIKSRKGEE